MRTHRVALDSRARGLGVPGRGAATQDGPGRSGDAGGAAPASPPAPQRTGDRRRHGGCRRPALLQSHHRRTGGRRDSLGCTGRLLDQESLAVKDGRWLLLIHQLPPKPDYFRVKIWRRLQGLGAGAIKNSVYALPFTAQASEDFQWLRKEITAGGGEASVCRAAFVDGLSDTQIESLFRTARDADYAEVALAAERIESPADATRLERRLRDIAELDHFTACWRQAPHAAVVKPQGRRPKGPTH